MQNVDSVAEDRRRRKERFVRDLAEAVVNTPPNQDELAARSPQRVGRIQGLRAREVAKRLGVDYQQVLIWLRPYDLTLPHERNQPAVADFMGLTLDEFRSRYLFSQPVPARPSLEDRDTVAELVQQVDELRREVASLRESLGETGEQGSSR